MTEEVENEVEAQTEVNPIANMIDYITQSEFQKANDIFNDLLGQRVSDSLEQEKVAVAQAMYSPEEESEESDEDFEEIQNMNQHGKIDAAMDDMDDDLEVSDEELETAMADLESEEEIEV